MDLAYRTELRELNELNFARFDARQGERLAEFRTEFRVELGKTKTSLIWWMFGFWTGTTLATAGLILAILKISL